MTLLNRLWPYAADIVAVCGFLCYGLSRPKDLAATVTDECVETFRLNPVDRGQYERLVGSITERLCIERMRRAIRLCSLVSVAGVFGLTLDQGMAVRASVLFGVWLILFFVTSEEVLFSVRPRHLVWRKCFLVGTFFVYVGIILLVKSSRL